MKILFVVDSLNMVNKGGSIIAPKIIGDLISDFYKSRIDYIFFREKNLWKFLFKFIFSKPKYSLVNRNSGSIEIESACQFIIWSGRNLKNYNLIVLHGLWSAIYILFSYLSIFFKVPFCFQPHGSLDRFDINKRKKFQKLILGFLIYRTIFNYSSGVIFTSKLEAIKSRTFGSRIRKFDAFLTSPNKTDYSILSSPQKMIFLKKYKIKENEKIILFLNRIDPKKGLDILLKSLTFINHKRIPIVLLIAGDGDKKYVKEIKCLIKNLKLNNKVRFIGHIKGIEKNQILKLADLFILPSLNENFGISIIEALQNKLPVIITKNVYIYKNIIKEKAGYLCNRDPRMLANLITDVILNYKYEDFDNYLKCFNKNFSRAKCAKKHFEIYSQLVQISE